MNKNGLSEHGFATRQVLVSIGGLAILVALYFFGGALLQFGRESLMRRNTSAHYEILCPPAALSVKSATEFASDRETLFARLNKKLGDPASNAEIRIVFNPDFSNQQSSRSDMRPYSVSGTTIRARLDGRIPVLPASADAEALLNAAWGKAGNPQIARWTVDWLVGEWRGMEIGMAAAQVEQKIGHKNVASVLGEPPTGISSSDDQTLLGAAWISEVAEFGGPAAVRKLYSEKMPKLTIAEVTKALNTTPLELDRKWQLWMYAYLAGMPA
ncbi:MAG TPA: hypothetical protein VGI34_00735, partial [Candidatus Acidoferrales bacterium]